MPILTQHQIVRITDVMMRAGGASADHAGIVADHLANANLAGYDSHGLIRIPQYLKNIEDGELDPRAEPEVVGNHGGILQIDGHSTFGQVVATRATEMAIEKARDHGVSLVTMGNHTNTGRIGTYPEMAAAAGMAAIMFTGWAGGPNATLAPFGGREARLGTNPLAMAFPHAEGPPSLLIWLALWQLMGRYGCTVTRNRSFLILGSLISMGSPVGTLTISSMVGHTYPSAGCKGATRDMRSQSWSRFSEDFLARSLVLQERWICGQDPRYSSSTLAAWRP